MSIVNFAIPQVLERRIEQTIKHKGFASRAELFRFAVLRYLDEGENLPLAKNQRIGALSNSLGEVIKKKIGTAKLPLLEQQMRRMKNL